MTGGIVNLLDFDYIERFRERQAGPVDAVPTPFPTWNRISGGDGGCEGMARHWLVIIGGNPKRGKTLMALNMAERALRAGERVGMMSLEMSDPELASRFYAMLGKVPVTALQKGKHFDPTALDTTAERIMDLPYDSGRPALLVNSSPVYQLDDLLAYMKLLNREHGVRYFIVDYLQLVSLDDDDEAVRTVTKAVKHLRLFAKENKALIVCLSQFKRSVSEDYTSSPQPQGLFGGGAIEQAADQIVLIDHSLYEYDAQSNTSRTWLKITNRHGQHGDIPILWRYKDLTAHEGLPDEEHLWPSREGGRRRNGKR